MSHPAEHLVADRSQDRVFASPNSDECFLQRCDSATQRVFATLDLSQRVLESAQLSATSVTSNPILQSLVTG